MYILKNALTQVTRNKGRNILIGVIIFIIALSSSIALAIYNTSNNLIDSYENKYDTEATLGINRDNMMKDFDKDDKDKSKEDMEERFSNISVSLEDIESYADSNYVKNYYYTIKTNVNIDDIEKASMSDSNNFGPKKDSFKNQTEGDFTLIGYSSTEAMSEFTNGTYKITEGEAFTDFESNTCLINSELSTLNDISVGDNLTIVNPLDEDKTYTLTVVGIYEETNDNEMSMFTSSANTIITNANFLNEITSDDDLSKEITPTFILISKDVIEDFENEIREKGLSDNLSVQTNLDTVNNSTKTISNLKTFSLTFLILTVLIGTIVLFIVNMINIRERKYEIGVLRTIGMKKRNVILQFLYELLIVSFISLLLGTAVGSTLSVPVSNYLLQNEIESSKQEIQNVNDNFGHKEGEMNNIKIQGNISVQEIDSINAVVDYKVLLELLFIGLTITLISCSSSIISIQRFSPLTILKERT